MFDVRLCFVCVLNELDIAYISNVMLNIEHIEQCDTFWLISFSHIRYVR